MKTLLFLSFVLIAGISNCQIISSHFYISDSKQLNLTNIHNNIMANNEATDYILDIMFSDSSSFVLKVAIADQINSYKNKYKNVVKDMEEYADKNKITKSDDILLITALLTSKFDINGAWNHINSIELKLTNSLSKFLVIKYIELNYLEYHEKENEICQLGLTVIETYDKSIYKDDISGEIKELFYDVFDKTKDYCNFANTKRYESVKRVGYEMVAPKYTENYESNLNIVPNHIGGNENRKSQSIDLIFEDGIYKIPVTINNSLKINFILDSGASDVHIPFDVFSTLMRMNKIEMDEIIGTSNYKIADGSIVKNFNVMLKSLTIGSIEIKAIKASVGSIESELLLGQSFQKRFNEVRIDNVKHKAVFYK